MRKSATAAPGERPTVNLHYESFLMERPATPPEKIVLIDDVVTGDLLQGALTFARKVIADKRPLRKLRDEKVRLAGDAAAVQETGAAGEPAVFSPAGFLGKGQLVLPDGRSYGWKMTSFWGSRWAFVDDSDRPLVSFTSRNRFFRAGCDVELGAGTLARPELPIFVLLGWYLLLKRREDSAAGAGG